MNQMPELPQAIQSFLREYIRQRNRMLFWRGAIVLGIVGVGWIVLCGLADRIWRLDAMVRTALLGTIVVGLGLWLIALLRATLLAEVDVEDAALELENLRPDLDERLETVCSRLRDKRGLIASPEMLHAVADQVERYLSEKGLPRLISLHTLGRHAACGVVLVLCVVGLSLMPVLGAPRLFKRIVLPWTRTAPVTTTHLEPLYNQENIDVAEGQMTVINLLADKAGPEGVLARFTTDGKTWDTRPMVCVGPYQYQAILPASSAQQRFVVSSGDAETEATTISILRKPSVAGFRIRYEYPPYMKREPLTTSNSDGLIEAPAGTKVSVAVVATERVSTALLNARDFSLPLVATIEPTVVEGSFTITKDQPYQVRIVSSKGLEGTGPQGSQIRVIPDRAPFVQLDAPGDDMRLSPRDITALRYQAMDDYGVSSLVLHLQVNNSQPIDMPLRMGSKADSRRYDGDQDLDLANLGLKIGDVVGVSLVARDGAGQSGTSQTRYIFISPHSVAADDYARMSDLQRALDATRGLGKDVASAIQSLDKIAAQRNQPEKIGEAVTSYQQNIAESGQHAEELKQSLSRAIARSQDPKLNDLLANMADRAQVRMVEAHDLIDEPNQGQAREQNAKQRLQRSLEQTKQMQQQLETLVNGERAAAALADRRNLEATKQAQASGKMTPRASEMLGRMKQDVADQTRQLGLNPDDPNVDKQLQQKSDAAVAVAKAGKNVDFAEAAKPWADQLMEEKVHPPMFDRRLSAAADVESVRRDSDLQRAADLNLAARASQAIWLMSQDPQNRAVADQARHEFVQALTELEKQQTRSGNAAAADPQRVAQARRQLAQFAGESDGMDGPAATGPEDPRMRDIAMQANAEMANRRYDRAAELQRRMAMEQQQAAQAAEALQEAKQADQLEQMQDSLRGELSASEGEAAALAQRQREVARRIAAQMGDSDTGDGSLPHDSRRDAMAAIQAVQERLAQMPQQLQDTTQAADVQFQAHELVDRLARDAEKAPPERKAAAAHSVDRGKAAETDSVKQTRQTLLLVDPDVVKVMSTNLGDFQPETTAAIQVLDAKLAPALDSVHQATTENKAPELLRAVKQSREAIALAQQELRDAQARLMDRDPLYAAQIYAEQAAKALSRLPADVAGAKANQQMAAQALDKQRSQSMREAAAAHLSGSNQFRAIYASEAPQSGKDGAGAGTAAKSELAGARQWGTLRDRQGADLSAAAREDDPSGYQKMLQVYFRTLGKATEGAK